MPDGRRLDDVKVGLFVLVAASVLVVGTLWVSGSRFSGGQRVIYRVLMHDSGGIKAGDRVRFAGVDIGRVRRLDLDPAGEWPVVFQVAIDASIPLRADSSASITSPGILGSSYLQIEAGQPDAPLLPAGGDIHGQPSMGLDDVMHRVDEIAVKVSGLLDQLTTILGTVSEEVGPVLDGVRKLLSDENARDIREILSTLQVTLEESGPRITSLLGRLDTVAGQVEDGLEGIPDLAHRLEELVADVRAAIGEDGERVRELLESARVSLDGAGSALSLVTDNRDELSATLRDLRDAVANLKAFSQQIKERPYSLVRIRPPEARQPGAGTDGKKR